MNKGQGGRSPKIPLRQGIPRAIAITAAIFVLLISLAELKKIGVTGAPVGLVYASIGVSAVALIAQLPQIFLRLPTAGRITATALLVGAIAVAQMEASAMDPVWMASAEGKKDADEIAAQDRARAEEAAKAEASEKAESDAKARQDLADKQAALEAQKPSLCKALASEVVDGDKVLEVNNVEVATTSPGQDLTCTGDAITKYGSRRVEFGLLTTPQGKQLISTHWPD